MGLGSRPIYVRMDRACGGNVNAQSAGGRLGSLGVAGGQGADPKIVGGGCFCLETTSTGSFYRHPSHDVQAVMHDALSTAQQALIEKPSRGCDVSRICLALSRAPMLPSAAAVAR